MIEALDYVLEHTDYKHTPDGTPITIILRGGGAVPGLLRRSGSHYIVRTKAPLPEESGKRPTFVTVDGFINPDDIMALQVPVEEPRISIASISDISKFRPTE